MVIFQTNRNNIDFIPALKNSPVPFDEKQIVFEDNHLIAVNKKSGQIVQGDKTGDIPLSDLVKDFLKIKYQKPGNVFCGVIHRLDRPVTGLVLFAKTSKGLSRMNTLFRDRKTEKIYLAVVKNKPPQEKGTLLHYLKKNEKQNKSYAFDKPVEGALECKLDYTLLASSTTFHLLQVNPLSGRHHQIRAQLSAMGCPIRGDLKYGFDRSNPDGSIHLHAWKLNFNHPVSDSVLNLVAPPPDEKIWNLFDLSNFQK